MLQVSTTAYGGRGLFSTTTIAKGTLVHHVSYPYISSIYRVFRKEVCAFCFAYARDADKNTWSHRLEDNGAGAWFCKEGCRNAWKKEYGDNLGVCMMASVTAAIDKAAFSRRGGTTELSDLDAYGSISGLDITPELVEAAWVKAHSLRPDRSSKPFLLEDVELDIARFISVAIVRRYVESKSPPLLDPNPSPTALDGHYPISTSLTWDAFLKLQDNEVLAIRSRPYRLPTILRVYVFLRSALSSIPELARYVNNYETIRAVFAREHGNAFGLWEDRKSEESEMFGAGIYVSGSYFNHDCRPNVLQKSEGPALLFVTMREILPGEELCISYNDSSGTFSERRENLMKNWFFDCLCIRCGEEQRNLDETPRLV